MKQSVLITSMLLFAGWSLVTVDVELDSYEAKLVDNQPVITWEARRETDLKHYEITRKTRFDADFKAVAEFEPRGPRHLYVYRDLDVYKAAGELVQYELIAVSTSDVRTSMGPGPVSVEYTPTAVRRTWGSIKAMFQ